VCGDHIYAQTIQTFLYLQQRLAAGQIALPDSSQALASFGHYKSVMDRNLDSGSHHESD
jgi:hypothetical protein